VPHIRVVYPDEGLFYTFEPPALPHQLVDELFGYSGDALNPYDVKLSFDGERIVFLNAGYPNLAVEVIAMDFDGSNVQTLLSRTQINQMEADMYDYKFDTLIERITWIPQSHRLLFTTAGPATHFTVYESNSDLYTVNADTGHYSRLLKRGDGGIAVPSPDGRRIAIRKSDALSINSINGPFFFRDIIPDSIRFIHVDRNAIVWTKDSSRFGFILLGIEDATVYSADGITGEMSLLGSIPPYLRAVLSPTLQYVGLTDGNRTSLFSTDGKYQIQLTTELGCFLSFAPDGQHFAYSVGNPPDNFSFSCSKSKTKLPVYIGSLEGKIIQIPYDINPEYFRWINDSQFVFINENQLLLGDTGGNITPITAVSGNISVFDVVDLDFQAGGSA